MTFVDDVHSLVRKRQSPTNHSIKIRRPKGQWPFSGLDCLVIYLATCSHSLLLTLCVFLVKHSLFLISSGGTINLHILRRTTDANQVAITKDIVINISTKNQVNFDRLLSHCNTYHTTDPTRQVSQPIRKDGREGHYRKGEDEPHKRKDQKYDQGEDWRGR